MKFNWLFLLFISSWTLFSCNGQERKNIDENKLKEPLISINKSKLKKEEDQIDAYVKTRKWKMKRTGTGLRYMIYTKGKGKLVKDGNKVLVDYTVTLLNGDTAYTSFHKKPQEFLVGRDNVETGLHEGILYLKKGDKAKMILPAHLAHGLVGDKQKIPPRSTIIYDISVLEIKE